MKQSDQPFDPLSPIQEEEEQVRWDLRPKQFSEYIGQKQIVEMLKIAVEAAKKRRRSA